MRFHSALLVIVAAALGLSAVAVAGNGPREPGRPETTKAMKPGVCQKHRAVVLKGTFLAASNDSFQMNVVRANRHGRALKGEQSLNVDGKTKLRRNGKAGKASLSDLVKGDRLHVLARCRPGETAGSFTLLAKLVWARGAKPAETEEDSG